MVSYLINKAHFSWIITALSLGFLLGVASTRLAINPLSNHAVILLAGVILSGLVLLSRLRLLMPIALIAGAMLGLVRGSEALIGLDKFDQFVGESVTVRGLAADDPTIKRGKTTISLTDLELTDTSKRTVHLVGKIWSKVAGLKEGQIKRADQLEVTGIVSSGFGTYAVSMNQARVTRISRSIGADPLGQLRDNFSQKLTMVMTKDQAGLGMGLLAGQKAVLSDQVQAAFIAASLTHIVVASGYNLTVLVRFSRRLLAKRSRFLALALSIILILSFAGLTGASASMTRAAIVTILSLLLWFVGRKAHPVVLLTSVAAVTVMIEPDQLWGDVGWYLSFGSFAGVIILAPLINSWINQLRRLSSTDQPSVKQTELTPMAKLARRLSSLPGSLSQVLIETASAQLITWPIIALFMGNVSLIGLLTNLLVLPLIPLTMLLTFLTGLGVYLLPGSIMTILSEPARNLLDYIIGVAKWGSTLPGASLEFQPTISFVIIYYLVILIITVILRLVTRYNFYGANVVE